MAMEFYIRQGSVNNKLRMEVINDGRYDYRKSLINYSLLDSKVTFTMKNIETGLLKISKAPAEIVLAKTDGCDDKYILQYTWKPRDTKEEGIFEGWFDITFNGNLTQEGESFLTGNFRVPIEEKLLIYIRE